MFASFKFIVVYAVLIIASALHVIALLLKHGMAIEVFKLDNPIIIIMPCLVIISIIFSRIFYLKRLEANHYEDEVKKVKDYLTMVSISLAILIIANLILILTIYSHGNHLIFLLSFILILSLKIYQFPHRRKLLRELKIKD